MTGRRTGQFIPDKNKTLYDGVKAFGASTMKKGDTMAKMYFESIANKYGVNIKQPIKKLPRTFLEKILYGTGDEEIDFEYNNISDISALQNLNNLKEIYLLDMDYFRSLY